MKLKWQEIKAEQRSPEWFAARAGRLTGSAARDMLATIRSGEAAARRDLRVRLALERLTGSPEIEDLSHIPAVQRGVEKEPAARMMLEERTGMIVRETGFICANDILVGCSLDGDDGTMKRIVEIKCPKSATHIGYLEAGVLPSTYEAQVTHNLWVTGAEACEFVSFDDRLPPGLDYFHVTAYARDLDIEGYAKKAISFLSEVEDLYHSLKRKAA